MKKYKSYEEIVKELGDDIVIIHYPFRWGGHFRDKSFWCALIYKTTDVYDYHLKGHLKKDLSKKGYKWIVVRHHFKGNTISILEKCEQLIAPNQNSASQVVNDEHNISLKDNSDELSQISSNDETSLNNNIRRNF